ncbi:MAG: tetraacyldisaccharide 4-kinase [Thermovirga sp.]|nr:tetraacyldisaccharide 4-kinase [Thermovirga sp.]
MPGSVNFSLEMSMGRILIDYLHYIRGSKSSFLWNAMVPLGCLADFLTLMRNKAYDHGIFESLESPVPVVSVGNLTVGGTNKTPVVEMLARLFDGFGLKVGIISRGYGKKSKGPHLIREGSSYLPEDVGDEPFLLSQKLPKATVCVSSDRLEGVDLLAREGVDLVIADDAFQHRRMGRDVDILLVDATCPWGNGRIFPAGLLRERKGSIKRAHMVIITKADQVERESLRKLKDELSRFVDSKSIFEAHLELSGWACWNGEWKDLNSPPKGEALVFSAIGNPASFEAFLRRSGVEVKSHLIFRDHHRFTEKNLEEIDEVRRKMGSQVVICTEKDVLNLPAGCEIPFEVVVPKVRTMVVQEERFLKDLISALRPKVVVASNGYGEDAIGALLAGKLKKELPHAEVMAFPLVGRGKEYEEAGIKVCAPPYEMPSEGVIKYHLKDLLRDLKRGLLRNLSEQMKVWASLRGKIRTVLCVGDVYLLLNVLWGQGTTPVLMATAKTEKNRGHFSLEYLVLRRRARCVWTRDKETRDKMIKRKVNAVYCGNPIMDLAGDNVCEEGKFWEEGLPGVLLLPGSRRRAYQDVKMLLEAAELVNKKVRCRFVMVLAATIDEETLLRSLDGWKRLEEGMLVSPSGNTKVILTRERVGTVARGAKLVIGLGGTANQICAGLGVPVVSILEKGKLVQKKLLGESEVLVEPSSEALSREVLAILEDNTRRMKMSRAGVSMMGPSGAVEDVVRYALKELGWKKRHDVWMHLDEVFAKEGDGIS